MAFMFISAVSLECESPVLSISLTLKSNAYPRSSFCAVCLATSQHLTRIPLNLEVKWGYHFLEFLWL
uniref:Uncharacterized protein n=1 Tax=Anguilla anguilla TaxID=7936 RepID=A0A0E9XFR2_ANGAN